ncbi:MAG TPA: hypothetical protein VGF60_17950 [Xanthobacteraceae bacterium]|jgi:hypothetical protein
MDDNIGRCVADAGGERMRAEHRSSGPQLSGLPLDRHLRIGRVRAWRSITGFARATAGGDAAGSIAGAIPGLG